MIAGLLKKKQGGEKIEAPREREEPNGGVLPLQLTSTSHVTSMEGRWPRSPNARGVYRVGWTESEQR